MPASDQSNKNRVVMKLSSFAFFCLVFLVGCGKDDNRTVVTFWHTQSGPKQKALHKIIDDFNKSQPTYRVVPQFIPGYDQIYRKMVVNIRANKMPALAVAYESMVARYHQVHVVVDLDEYLHHPDYGLSEESLADIFPQFMAANRFKHYDNKLLSFPFTKSILMMYYNKGLLEELGFEPPPETWTEFAEMCRAVKSSGKGRRGYAISIDASTIDAMVYSFGGNVVNESETRTLFDTPAARRPFELLKSFKDEGLGYVIQTGSYDDRVDLASDRATFMIRSSTHRPYLGMQVEALKEEGQRYADWSLGMIPHAEGRDPVTVMFGANICMLKTTPEVQRGAWEFIKYFVSTQVTAEWAAKSGYLPVRKSALATETLRRFFAEYPRALKPLEALPYATNEPTVEGWQEVRNYIEDAERAVLTGSEVDEAVATLTKKSNRLLDEIHAGVETEVPLYFTCSLAAIVCVVGVVVWRMRRRLTE